MNIFIYSSSFIYGQGLKGIIEQNTHHLTINNISIISTYAEIKAIVHPEMSDTFIFSFDELNEKEFNNIINFKHKYPNVKVIILDKTPSKFYIFEAVNHRIDGYLAGDLQAYELDFAIYRVNNQQRYFNTTCLEIIASTSASILSTNSIMTGINLLTKREKEIATLIGKGLSNGQIGEQLCISENTVKKHIYHIFKKLDIGDRISLISAYNDFLLQKK